MEDEEKAILEASLPERSIHEAGHTVACIHLGYPVKYTTIIPTDEWAGHTEAPGLRFTMLGSISDEEVREHAMVVCASAAAYAISKDEASEDEDFDKGMATESFSGAFREPTGRSDWELFRNCVEFLILEDNDSGEGPPPFEKRYEEVWYETVAILQGHWPTVEALARALLERGRLERDEIEEIWEATEGPLA